MPILAAEPNLCPVDLFKQAEVRAGRRWRVLHTKPRQEKTLARHLVQAGIPFYLPLLERKVPVRGRFVTSFSPLFTSYLFLLASDEERIGALSTKRVVHSIEVHDQAEMWNDLAQVDHLIGSGMPVTPEQRLHRGAIVEIRSGALAGLKGRIIREATRQRFVVEVNFIQRGASVTLPDYVLAAVKE